MALLVNYLNCLNRNYDQHLIKNVFNGNKAPLRIYSDFMNYFILCKHLCEDESLATPTYWQESFDNHRQKNITGENMSLLDVYLKNFERCLKAENRLVTDKSYKYLMKEELQDIFLRCEYLYNGKITDETDRIVVLRYLLLKKSAFHEDANKDGVFDDLLCLDDYCTEEETKDLNVMRRMLNSWTKQEWTDSELKDFFNGEKVPERMYNQIHARFENLHVIEPREKDLEKTMTTREILREYWTKENKCKENIPLFNYIYKKLHPELAYERNAAEIAIIAGNYIKNAIQGFPVDILSCKLIQEFCLMKRKQFYKDTHSHVSNEGFISKLQDVSSDSVPSHSIEASHDSQSYEGLSRHSEAQTKEVSINQDKTSQRRKRTISDDDDNDGKKVCVRKHTGAMDIFSNRVKTIQEEENVEHEAMNKVPNEDIEKTIKDQILEKKQKNIEHQETYEDRLDPSNKIHQEEKNRLFITSTVENGILNLCATIALTKMRVDACNNKAVCMRLLRAVNNTSTQGKMALLLTDNEMMSMSTLQAVEVIQKKLPGYRILLFDTEKKYVFIGNEQNSKILPILDNGDGTFSGIKSINQYFGTRFYCTKCLTSSNMKKNHVCK